MSEKPIIYEEIPMFNQLTQYVVQLEPVDKGDHYFVPVEIREMELDDSWYPDGVMPELN